MNLAKLKKSYFLIMQFLLSIVSLESFKELFNDKHGGLVLPISGSAYNDEDFLEYQRLEVDWTIKPVNPNVLPSDFCDDACKLVDEFKRKTVNENVEWMLYFDYKTGEVIYCWKGGEGKSGGNYEKIHFNGRDIASIHSHPNGYYSFPSPENFDILENAFEDYEIITSNIAIWIVEFKGKVEKEIRSTYQNELRFKIDKIKQEVELSYSDANYINLMVEKFVGNYFLSECDKYINDISLIFVKIGD